VEPARSKLKFQCRRGLKELDIIFENYLKNDFQQASESELINLQKLLQLEDNELLGLILAISLQSANNDRPIHYLCQYTELLTP